MKNKVLIIASCIVAVHLGLNFNGGSSSSATPYKFDLNDFEKKKIALKHPLLTISGSKGFIACGYIDVKTCKRNGEACAIVNGVNNFEEMLKSPINAVSPQAKLKGVKKGMTGQEALSLLK